MRSTLFAVVALVVGLVAPGVASAGPAPTTVTVTVAYGQLPDQTVDVTFDPQHARGRAVVGFHGGSGTGGSKANLAKAAATLARSGFVVFNVEYRKTTSDLGPLGSHWDAQRADAVAALDWARAHATTFGADPARFATYGFSWGGLLAATVGLEGQGTRKVQAVVSVAGVLQPQRVAEVALRPDPHLQEGQHDSGDRSTPAVRGLYRAERIALRSCEWTRAASACGKRWQAFLPENLLSAGDPAVLAFQGTADEAVPPGTLAGFGDHLTQHHVRHTMVPCRGVGHTDVCAFDGGAHQRQLLEFLLAATA